MSANASLRLVVMGTGPFAVPMFEALYDTPHTVVALVTQPSRSASGRGPAPPNPMRAVAEKRGTTILDPESVNTDEARAQLKKLKPDLFVVADYGQILRPETLAVARLGGINLHGSLLPKYRGAAPIAWAIYHGERESGVSVIHMTPRVDSGPVLAQARTPIDPDEDAASLEHRLSVLGAPLVAKMIDEVARGNVKPLEQNAAEASPARRLRKTDGVIDWNRSAEQIRNQIRALEPWPRTAAAWQRKHGEPLRLIVCHAFADAVSSDAAPGTVVEVTKQHIAVATGDGRLLIDRLQAPGKRAMSVTDFLNGQSMDIGDCFT
jgi:methionyl-tRNA formyltransferase